MQEKATQDPTQAAPLLVVDHVMAPMIGLSVHFLQKDRRGPQRIPFIRLGDRVLYDPQEVMAAVKALTVGGPRGRRGRRSTSVEGA